ncbi:hypothetical protein KOR42_47550 [Thalassoglobus neptunius]|uniref:Uncharacterized protein n=1 Tax=Thalassoglobus neptunius TaxID=1938619 RepID=A0A5C5VTI7_9PLAN|nr:hypothetical protein KOR42_47550 [Thalassoglobus neptunius]
MVVPQMVVPQMVVPQMVVPQMVVPQMVVPQMVVPQMVGPQMVGPVWGCRLRSARTHFPDCRCSYPSFASPEMDPPAHWTDLLRFPVSRDQHPHSVPVVHRRMRFQVDCFHRLPERMDRLRCCRFVLRLVIRNSCSNLILQSQTPYFEGSPLGIPRLAETVNRKAHSLHCQWNRVRFPAACPDWPVGWNQDSSRRMDGSETVPAGWAVPVDLMGHRKPPDLEAKPLDSRGDFDRLHLLKKENPPTLGRLAIPDLSKLDRFVIVPADRQKVDRIPKTRQSRNGLLMWKTVDLEAAPAAQRNPHPMRIPLDSLHSISEVHEGLRRLQHVFDFLVCDSQTLNRSGSPALVIRFAALSIGQIGCLLRLFLFRLLLTVDRLNCRLEMSVQLIVSSRPDHRWKIRNRSSRRFSVLSSRLQTDHSDWIPLAGAVLLLRSPFQ